MALELDIKINNQITVGALFKSYENIAKNFIPCSYPIVEYKVKLNGSIIDDGEHMVMTDGTYIQANLLGMDGFVTINVYECPPAIGYEDDENTGTFLTIASSRNDQAILLTALLSISVAKLSDSHIEDQYHYWTSETRVHWKKFIECVKIEPSQEPISFSEFCIAFNDNLPRATDIQAIVEQSH